MLALIGIAMAMVSAIVPSLLLLWYFHSRDAYPEPAGVVWATFGLGVLSIVPTLVVAFPLMLAIEAAQLPNAYLVGFLEAFFTAAIPEELFKMSVLVLFAGRRSAFDEPMDGLVYGVAASLGFATLENVLYCAQGGIGLAIVRALTAVPMHAGCGAVMGYYYGRARYSQDRGRLLALAYFVPMMLHGLYDWPLLAMKGLGEGIEPTIALALAGAGIFMLAVVIAWARVSVKQARIAQRPELANPPVATTGSRVTGVLALLTGLLLASVGGLMCLGLLVALAQARPDQTTNLIIGGAVIGVLPLALGLGAFAFGIKLLNRRSAGAAIPLQRAA